MLLTLVTSLVISATPSITSSSSLSADQVRRLEKNEIMVEGSTPPDGEGVAATMLALVRAPVAAVIPAVHDCEHFHEFVPRTVKSKERSRKGNHRVCFVEVEMPFPISNMWSVADVYGVREKDGRFIRRWYTKEGTFKKNLGSWFLIPWGSEKKETLAVYHVETQPDIAVPDFLISHGQATSLPNLITAIRKRVAR